MSYVNDTLGNIYIKHNDKWRGDYYLKDDLTFTVDKTLAGRFYLLKSGDTTIINGDRISINTGNRTLSLLDSLRLIDRDQNHNTITTFLITNGTDNTDPITFETPLYIISDKDSKTALKYEWGMDLIGPVNNNILLGAVNYKPHECPKLANSSYGDICPNYINTFEFYFEKADGPITNLDSPNAMVTKSVTRNEFIEGYKGAIMVVLLMIVLILCIMIGK